MRKAKGLNMAPGIGVGLLSIAGFDANGFAKDSKQLWEAKTRRRAARTDEEREQIEREKDFDAIWLACWFYYSERVGEKHIVTKGEQLRDWHYGSLLYNYLLRKARGLRKLRFKLSDIKIRNRPMVNIDLLHVARLGDKDNLTAARKQLAAMGLVEFGPWESRKTDYSVTLLNPPARRGKKRPLSDATIKHGHVSAVHPRLHWRDDTAEIDERIMDELGD